MAQLTCNFYSTTIGGPAEVEITLPSKTSCPEDQNTDHSLPALFPVVYLLHGHGNDCRCWGRYTSAERYAEEHRIALVSMSVGNSNYENQPGQAGRFFDFVSEELPSFVTSYFPVSSRPEDTYLCGYSMGGYGAAIHAFLHPEKYAAAGLFSPAILPPGDRQLDGLLLPFGYDPCRMAEELVKKGTQIPRIFLCIGEEDFLKDAVVRAHEEFERAGLPHRFDLLPGYRHEYAFWDRELEEFLRWIPRTDPYAGLPLHIV